VINRAKAIDQERISHKLHSQVHNSKERNREEFSDLILSAENLRIDFIGPPNFVAVNEIRASHVIGIDDI
jgi:hypothetical protein